ncbi:MAG TPA: hypothetical protein GXX14_04895 [Clostridiaceae bacterium]|nr:hypothetical protein [Clostridiaceae bacterium]
MFCEKCGQQNETGVNFCINCGNKLAQDVPNRQLSQKSDSKTKSILKVIIPAAIALAIILIALTLTSGGPGNFYFASDSITIFKADGSFYISGNNNATFSLDSCSYISNVAYSMDGSKAAILTNEHVLWFVTTNEKKEVAEDVDSFTLSADGSTIAYLTDDGGTATLYVYDTSSGKKEKITDEAGFFAVLSPDGKSIAYTKIKSAADFELDGYIKMGNKSPEKLGENTVCFALSNGGQYLYYFKYDNNTWDASVYAKKGNKETKLFSTSTNDLDDIFFHFNRDLSQAIFSYDGKSYLCKNADEKVKLINADIIEIITPANSRYVKLFGDSLPSVAYGLEDLSNIVLLTDNNSLEYLNKKAETTTIETNCTQVQLSEDGKTLYYLYDGDKLIRKNLAKIDAAEEEIADDIMSYVVSTDGSKVYYVNYIQELYYIRKGSSKPKKIADDVRDDSLCITSDGNVALYLADYNNGLYTLYYSMNGGKKKKIADDVYKVMTTTTSAFYLADSDKSGYDLYRSKNGTKFEKLKEEVGDDIISSQKTKIDF